MDATIERQFKDNVIHGDLDACKALLERFPEEERRKLLISKDWNGWNALHFAVNLDFPSIVEWLLSTEMASELIHSRTSSGSPPLHLAIAFGELGAVIRMLVDFCEKIGKEERRKLINSVDNEGRTILHRAASVGSVELITWILSDADFECVLNRSVDGLTAFTVACELASKESCRAILDHCTSADREQFLTSLTANGSTNLHVAAGKGEPEIVSLLLSDYCRVSDNNNNDDYLLVENEDGHTPFHLAAMEGHFDVCRVLAWESSEERRRELFSRFGRSIIFAAAEFGHQFVVQWLLSEDEDGGIAAGFNRKDMFGRGENSESILHCAIPIGSTETLDEILDHCQTPSERMGLLHARDDDGRTILHTACTHGLADVHRHLLRRYNAEMQTIVDVRDKEGFTALHRAILASWDLVGFIDPEESAEVAAALLGMELGEGGGDEEEEEEDDDGVHHAAARTAYRMCLEPQARADPNVGVKFEE